MKKGILIILAVTMLFIVIAPPVSHAWGRGHGYYPRYHGGHGWAIPGIAAGGLLVGAAIGSMLAPPVYVAPPARAYYYPPPPPPRAYYHRHAPRVVYVYPY